MTRLSALRLAFAILTRAAGVFGWAAFAALAVGPGWDEAEDDVWMVRGIGGVS